MKRFIMLATVGTCAFLFAGAGTRGQPAKMIADDRAVDVQAVGRRLTPEEEYLRTASRRVSQGASMIGGYARHDITNDGGDSYSMSAKGAFKLFNRLQVDLGKAKPGTDGSDFPVADLELYIDEVHRRLSTNLTDRELRNYHFELGVLNAFLGAVEPGSDEIRAVDLNDATQDGRLHFTSLPPL
jgi:hypothetical protein